MTDLDIIEQLQIKLNRKIKKLQKNDSYYTGCYHYSLNENEKVIALNLRFEEDSNIKNKLIDYDLDVIVDSISQLEYLKYLNLRGNNLYNIDSLSKLTNVLYLDLSENSIINIDSIGKLTQLKCLNLELQQ